MAFPKALFGRNQLMFQGWRIKIREAEEAYQQGLLDAAHRLLVAGELQGFAPAKKLCAQVGQGLADRSLERLSHGDVLAALRDFEAARSLAGETAAIMAVYHELNHRTERQVKCSLESGDLARPLSQLEEMQKRQLTSPGLQQLYEVAMRLRSAEQLSVRGRFAEADQQVAAAMALRSDLPSIPERQLVLRKQQTRHRKLTQKLHQALADKDWNQVLKMAERLLEIAPQNGVAQDAKRRAWGEVGAHSRRGANLRATEYWTPSQNQRRGDIGGVGQGMQEAVGNASSFVLWVDAVGGYLVCLSDEVVIGQSVPASGIAVPIKADLSRRHAKVKRRGDGYVLEPLAKTRIGGQQVCDVTLLNDGDEIELGEGVKLRFRQPHALSATARLEWISRHKTHPTADAVLLMAESCVLGPHWQNHVVCRQWSADVVLFRQKEELFCRAGDSISVDGEWHEGKGRLGKNSHICGDEFSMSLEAVPSA